jgi:hypothetical protein
MSECLTDDQQKSIVTKIVLECDEQVELKVRGDSSEYEKALASASGLVDIGMRIFL